MEPGQVILYLFLTALFVFWLILLVSMFIPEHKKKPFLKKIEKHWRLIFLVLLIYPLCYSLYLLFNR